MDENEKTPPQKPESEKKLKLDLSEAMNQGFDDDDIIELKDEVTPPPKAKMTEIDRDGQVGDDTPADEALAETGIGVDAFGKEADVAKDVDHLVDDLVFEEEDEEKENLDFSADRLPFEEEDDNAFEIPPLVDEEEPLKADADSEVVEITEFDDFLSEDSNEMTTLSDVAEESETEEEFLELIDVEEDDLTEDESLPQMVDEAAGEEIEDDIIQFDGPGADVEDTELEDFINDSLGEEIRIDDNFEDDLTNALEVEGEADINLADTPSSTEDFDFEIDSSEISEKIDQLDTIFFSESEAEEALDEDAESETEAIGSILSHDSDEDDEFSEIADKPETIFFDASEAEDELDEGMEPETEAIESAVLEVGDETDEIFEKIDRLENTFFDESEAEDELDEDVESELEAIEMPEFDSDDETDREEIEATDDKTEEEDIKATEDETEEEDIKVTEDEPPGELPAEGALAALAGASREQIEETIERVIVNNFSDKIESIVTETIEKAVSKEIERLKSILLEDGGDDNF
jgi:hypothetical protein